MENASKAIIMAGSVLIALLVIAALVFMFQSLSNLKAEEARATDTVKLAEYNQKIEVFNRTGIYGSEVVSLANLIDDYNQRQSDLKGYKPIKLTVKINLIAGASYFTQNTYNAKTLVQQYEALERKVNEGRTAQLFNTGKTAADFAGMRENEFNNFVKEHVGSLTDSQITRISQKALEYTTLKSELTEFKNKYFKNAPKVTYDKSNGRITAMIFSEK
ncbi:MAG: hypothetical protein IJ777_02200 [Clostridia bacterium]|nr:hypothetical protein [Clostridia bacterium]